MSQDRDPASLEEKVAELAATVDGLTDELVDAKERIRELEVKVGIREDPAGADGEDFDESMTVEELFEAADEDPIADDGTSEEDASEDGESPEKLGDDIIVG